VPSNARVKLAARPSLKVIVFYVLAFVFTIILVGIQEGASISPEAVILPQWASLPCSGVAWQ